MTWPRSLGRGLSGALLCVALAFGIAGKAWAVPPVTAPDGDLNGDGDVTAFDLQCFVVLYDRYAALDMVCTSDLECAVGELCRPAWQGTTLCMPTCLSPLTQVNYDAAACTDPLADTADCWGVAPRHLADLNCDGMVTNIDHQFEVYLLLQAQPGLGTPDVDGDGLLNFCDDDSDGDGIIDALDCGVLDPTIYQGAPELCDGVDNDCDGFTDAADPKLVMAPCENTAGACATALHVVSQCVGGAFLSCTAAEYAAGSTAWEATEATCDGIDNDCDGLTDAADPDMAGGTSICCAQAADCPPQFSASPVCDTAQTCQGHRMDAVCVNFVCTTKAFGDDGGCDASLLALACGAYTDQYCTGAPVQPQPTCPSGCANCDADAFCNSSGACIKNADKIVDGQACFDPLECVSGHCQNGRCCASGDCCAAVNDCPGVYGQPPVCDTAATCQGTRLDASCVNNVCNGTPVADDTACDASVVANGCGLYPDVTCLGGPAQTTPACAATCLTSADCDAAAFCSAGACLADQPDGGACAANDECLSGYCGGGICCAGGDCCLQPSDCPASLAGPSVCTDPGACQGARTDLACVGFQCATTSTPDDTGCDVSVHAFDCGAYGPVFCDGTASQSPSCSQTCVTDLDCVAGFHCDAAACLPDLANGGTCNENSDCVSQHCDSGYCCQSGTCCALSADCAAFDAPSSCVIPSLCQGFAKVGICSGSRCIQSTLTDDTACDPSVVAASCGLYADVTCDGAASQTAGSCQSTCATDADCDPTAGCQNGACVAKTTDGNPCTVTAECLSGHCQNGFCCAAGDCCDLPAACPANFSNPAVCVTPLTCQGERKDATCVASACGTVVVADDSGCAAGMAANACGAYPDQVCTGAAAQTAPTCATGCVTDADCDPTAFCSAGACLPKKSGGQPCGAANECLTSYCNSGFCCAGGDCCGGVLDCPAGYVTPPDCTLPESCQGTRGDLGCVAGQCVTLTTDDDSACGAGLLSTCGLFVDVVCAGGAAQTVAGCKTTCAADTDCDAGAHCDAGTCLVDVVDGGACKVASDCVSTHCQNGFCCQSGDCCAVGADCAPFVLPPTCQDPAQCQGTASLATCVANTCAVTTIQDDSGCDATVVAQTCGLNAPAVCDGTALQTAPACGSGCTVHSDCAANAYCLAGTCVADKGDGQPCAQNAECASDHCQAGLCCAGGDCCAVTADCPPSYSGAVCDDAPTCQGHLDAATCVSNVCGAAATADDSACDTATVADQCGLYKAVMCTGAATQTTVGVCPTTCAVNADCDDGLYCTGVEVCQNGSCVLGPPLDLSDGLPCTVDTCDEALDAIVHTPNDAACDNGLFCDGVEVCNVVTGCGPGAPLDLSDAVACTTDACDEATDQITHTASNAACDNGAFCDGPETCHVTQGCLPGTPPALDDGIPCTLDSCDETADMVLHVTQDALCDDGLFCTSDFCNKSFGCLTSVHTGFCIVDSTCILDGAASLGDACLICDAGTNQVGWSPRPTTPEVCNGADDDCDGLTDEDASGAAMTRACANACGGTGTESCGGGTWFGCTAPVVVEQCADSVDNDCDGLTDELDCFIQKPVVQDVELRMASTLGRVTNRFTALGGGRYEADVVDLRNPNLSGEVVVSSFGVSSGAAAFQVSPTAPAFAEAVVGRKTLYADRAETRILVAVKDAFDRPPAVGTLVQATFGGLPGGDEQASCSTDAIGRCTLVWVAPTAAFDGLGATVTASIRVGSLSPVLRTLTCQPRPIALQMAVPGCGAELPLHPVLLGEQFVVDVHLNAGAQTVGSYDLQLSFDPAKMKVVSVAAGTCAAFAVPANNAAVDANTTGTLKFNAAASGADACATGDVSVARITMAALAAGPVGSHTVSVLAIGVFDNTLATLLAFEPCTMRDATGLSPLGTVSTEAVAVSGILARGADSQLFYRQPISGVNDQIQMSVTGFRNDFVEVELNTSVETSYATSDSAVVPVQTGGAISAGTKAGAAVVTATYHGSSSTTRVRVLTPKVGAGEVTITLSDAQLNPIVGASGQMQTSQARVLVDWFDGTGVAFQEDITDQITWELPPAVTWDPVARTLAASQAGVYVVNAKGAFGNVLGGRGLQVFAGTVATCTGLVVVPACEIVVDELAPPAPSVTFGRTTTRVTVNGFMNRYLQTCPLQVYADFDDGTRMRVTGRPGLTVSSADSFVFTAAADGVLTAIADGQANANASWVLGGVTLCTGSQPVKVKLPKEDHAAVTPQNVVLAKNASDPAHTITLHPTGKQLKTTVVFQDGSEIDFTAHPQTTYDAVSLDPNDLVAVTASGFVTATGKGAGTATVVVVVGQYPTLPPVEVTVTVVEASGLTATLYEPYTPSGAPVTTTSFGLIEGSSTYQDGRFEVWMLFSDGVQMEVTNDPATVITPYAPGTTVPAAGIVALTQSPAHVAALAPGTVDVRFANAGYVATVANVTVTTTPANIATLWLDLPGGGATLSGIKGGPPVPLETWAVFTDGTRRKLYGADAIAGLLQYGSSVSTAATVDAAGLATLRGNAPTVLTAQVVAGMDAAPAVTGTTAKAADCNLLPSDGDIDLGDTVGLAHKDRAPSAQFVMEVRTNTGASALGAFDVDVSFDPAVLKAVSVAPGDDVLDAVFSGNVSGVVGKVLFNGTLPVGGVARKGPAIRIAKITFLALKGGAATTTVAGTVKSVVALSQVTPIGPPTPRPLIAGEGSLDPGCSGLLDGDVDGNCAVDERDLETLGAMLAGTRDTDPSADLDGDGRISARDLALLEALLSAPR